MKQKILLLTLLISFLLPLQSHAVSYRGFVEAGGGVNRELHTIYLDQPSNSYDFLGRFSLNTSHGIQVLHPLYVGAGIGCHMPFGLFISLYGNVRWDGFNITGKVRKVSPFIDLKVGYQKAILGGPAIADDSFMYVYDYANGDIDIYNCHGEYMHRTIHTTSNKKPGGLFVRPTLGIRIRMSNHVGLNIGVFCDIVNYIKLNKVENLPTLTYTLDGKTYESLVEIPAQTIKYLPFGGTIGVDF